jgi:hypothetical protein
MGQAVQNLRDILALARRLRDLARGYTHDRVQGQLLTAAAELEARAQFLATDKDTSPVNIKRDTALHAPVDLLI